MAKPKKKKKDTKKPKKPRKAEKRKKEKPEQPSCECTTSQTFFATTEALLEFHPPNPIPAPNASLSRPDYFRGK